MNVVLFRRIFELCAFLLSFEFEDFVGEGDVDDESKIKAQTINLHKSSK